MENDYRERWCQFLTAALSAKRTVLDAIFIADKSLVELKKKDKERAFDLPEKGYR